MAKANRTRRNRRKADQFKEFKAKNTRRKNVEKPEEDSAEMDALIERRTAAFLKIFDRMERENISEGDAKIIARFATKDGVISYAKNQDIEDLAYLKVEELTEFEFNSIVVRANRGINVIVQNRSTYTAGPFYINRGMRQAAIVRNRRARRMKVRKPTNAREIFETMKAKKAARQALGI